MMAKAKTAKKKPMDPKKQAAFEELMGAIDNDQAQIQAQRAEMLGHDSAPLEVKGDLDRGVAPDPDAPATEEARKSKEWAEDEDNPNAYLQYRNTPTDNARYRRDIEKRLEPLDFNQILEGKASQVVPIVPGSLEVEYQTVEGAERLFLDEKWGTDVENKTNAHAMNLMTIYSLALGVKALNDQVLPRLKVNDKGEVDEASFMVRVSRIRRLPEEVLDVLWTNHLWFRHRVMWAIRKGAVGNG
jgi:hypothetical protein